MNTEKARHNYRDTKGRFTKADTDTPDFLDELFCRVEEIQKQRNDPAQKIREGLNLLLEGLKDLPKGKDLKVTNKLEDVMRGISCTTDDLLQLDRILNEPCTAESDHR